MATGLYDHSERTFRSGVQALPPGHTLSWHDGQLRIACWYDIAERVGDAVDTRRVELVQEEYLALLLDSVRLRFRADVPVGINLSGGLDSSILLALVQKLQGAESNVKAFTFVTGDSAYDEIAWVEQMLAQTRHPSVVCRLDPADVPRLAASVQASQDEPFGGLPTLAYARLFEQAREQGVIVLLDGQGMDEQWAGYDYYRTVLAGRTAATVQGTNERPVRPECLQDDFAALAGHFVPPQPFADPLRNVQYRDLRYSKIPRALRFNDRVSMRVGTELREPFLDHRLFELALRQSNDRKIRDSVQKWLPRQLAADLVPGGVVEAPKRPLQTPQREWLRGPLKPWAEEMIEQSLEVHCGEWLKLEPMRAEWRRFCAGDSDNSFYVWQWISMALIAQHEVGI